MAQSGHEKLRNLGTNSNVLPRVHVPNQSENLGIIDTFLPTPGIAWGRQVGHPLPRQADVPRSATERTRDSRKVAELSAANDAVEAFRLWSKFCSIAL